MYFSFNAYAPHKQVALIVLAGSANIDCLFISQGLVPYNSKFRDGMKNTILLIEDDESSRMITAELLRMAGYEVIAAANGEDGIGMAKERQPALILCDIVMQVTNGYEVLRALQDEPDTRTIPFIFLTGRCEHYEIRKAMLMGADDYITKPLVASDLLEAVERRIEKRNRAQLHSMPDRAAVPPWQTWTSGGSLLEVAARVGKPREYKKNEMIFMEGAPNRTCLVIESGCVKTFKTTFTGKVCITGIYKEGELLGDGGLSGDTIISNSAVAIQPVAGYQLSKCDIKSVLSKNPAASFTYLSMISKRLSKLDDHLLSIAYCGVRKRVAHALLKLEEEFNGRDNEGATVIPLPLQDIACISGMTSESSYRVLSDFEKDGMIKRDAAGHILISNAELLKRIPERKAK